MNMKTSAYKIFFILLACVLGFTACQEEYVDEFETLELDYTRFNLKEEGGEFAFMVYFSGDWTISLDKEVDWLELEMTSGTGITPVHIYFKQNHLFARTVNMTISGGGETKTIAISQKPAVETPIFKFVEESISLTKGAYRVKTKMQSNLSEEAIRSQVPNVTYVFGEDWISNFDVRLVSDDYVVEGGTAVYTYDILFDIAANDSGEDRAATLSYYLSDEQGQEYGCEILVMQSTEAGKLILKESTIRGCKGKEYAEEITGGLERYEEDIVVEVSENDFIENVRVHDGQLFFTLKENTSSTSREATITLTLGEASATIRIIQREAGINAIYEIRTAQDLVAWSKDNSNWDAEDLVTLMNDIDCAGVVTSSNWSMGTFLGTFEGNNFTIYNFVVEKNNTAAFFAKIDGSAIVKNLTFGAGCKIQVKGNNASSRAATLANTITGEASLENIVSYAEVSISGTTTDSDIAGIGSTMNSTGSIKGCRNYGNITYSAVPSKWTDIAGVFAKVNGETTVEGCENYGKIEFAGASNGGQSINLGGVAGGGSIAIFKECANYGTLICSTTEAKAGGTNIGGIIGLSNSEFCGDIIDCTNGRQGDPTVGQIINNGKTSGEIRLGGCIGFIQNIEATITGFKNYANISNNYETGLPIMIGGVVGRMLAKEVTHTLTDCQNHGAITGKIIAGDKIGGVAGIAGICQGTADVAQSVFNITGCTNTGNVLLDGPGTGNCHVAGIVGTIRDNSTGTISGCNNSGDVRNGTATTTVKKWIYTGGIIGQFSSSTGVVKDCENSGDVINGVHCTQGGGIRFGGIVGNAENGLIENCTNSGAVKDISNSIDSDFGGIVGRATSAVACEIKGCSNTGDIVSNNTIEETTSWISGGGIVGRIAKGNLTIEGCTNNCKLQNTNTTEHEVLGGIAGFGAVKAIIKDCSSKAVITNVNSAAIRSGVFGGTWVKDFSVSGCSASGQYGETVLDSSNYTTYCFGSGSTFKDCTNISFK